jgi:hypothetical protein
MSTSTEEVKQQPIPRLVQAELARIGQRFESAEARRNRAQVYLQQDELAAARTELQECAGEFWDAGQALAELLLLLLRYCQLHEPDALRQALVEVLRPELQPLIKKLARLEGKP